MTCDSEMQETLQKLKDRYRKIAEELEAIKDDHALNQPEMKSQDGGTTLEKTKKIKQLEESLKAAAQAIKDHLDLCAAMNAGTTEPWTVESQLEL